MISTVKKEDGVTSRFVNEEALQKFRAYQTEYVKKNYRGFTFRVRRDLDEDVVQYCEAKDSLSAYIINLIKRDMVRNGIAPLNCDTIISPVDIGALVLSPATDARIRTNVKLTLDDGIDTSIVMAAANSIKCDRFSISEIDCSGNILTFSLSYCPSDSLANVINMAAQLITAIAKIQNDDVAIAYADKVCMFSCYSIN